METAGRIGVRPDRAVNYHADSAGTQVAFEALSDTIREARVGSPIRANWNSKIKADYESRAGKKAR